MNKKFTAKLICFFVSLLIIPAAYFIRIQQIPPMFKGSIMGSVEVKYNTLQQTPGSRIILVGGSSVPYSIECETVSAATDMPCISMGATAYLGIEYYLALIDDELHEGDIVIIAPEFAMLANSVGYSIVWTAVENSRQLISKLPVSYLPNMVKSFYTYSQNKLSEYSVYGEIRDSIYRQYESFGFGPYGDITFRRETLFESGYDKNNLYCVTDDSLSNDVIKSLNKFYKKAEKAGADVYMTWAPFDRLAYTGTQEDLTEFENLIKNKINIPYIGNLTDCLMDEKYFYDSNNHLTSQGATIRTEILIDDFTRAGVF